MFVLGRRSLRTFFLGLQVLHQIFYFFWSSILSFFVFFTVLQGCFLLIQTRVCRYVIRMTTRLPPRPHQQPRPPPCQIVISVSSRPLPVLIDFIMHHDVREGTLVIADSYLNDFSIFKQAGALRTACSTRRSAWPSRSSSNRRDLLDRQA